MTVRLFYEKKTGFCFCAEEQCLVAYTLTEKKQKNMMTRLILVFTFFLEFFV